jgi:hypothetical protein
MKASVIIQSLLAAVNPFDIIIIVLAVGAVVGYVAYAIWKKKNDKGGGCGCGCSGCPSAASCAARKQNAEQANEENKKD